MEFSVGQLDLLSKLLINLAKGLFLAALAGPAISSKITILISLRSLILGVYFVCISLKLIEIKEVLWLFWIFLTAG